MDVLAFEQARTALYAQTMPNVLLRSNIKPKLGPNRQFCSVTYGFEHGRSRKQKGPLESGPKP
jgi:hypothetical protein